MPMFGVIRLLLVCVIFVFLSVCVCDVGVVCEWVCVCVYCWCRVWCRGYVVARMSSLLVAIVIFV